MTVPRNTEERAVALAALDDLIAALQSERANFRHKGRVPTKRILQVLKNEREDLAYLRDWAANILPRLDAAIAVYEKT